MNVTLRQVRVALAILGAVVLALLLNRLIVTDKKRVQRTVQEMAEAAAKGDVDGLFLHISADYRDENMTRAELKSLAATFLEGARNVRPKVQRMTVNISGTLARVEMSVSCTEEIGGQRVSLGASDWVAEFRKEPDGAWRATSITPVSLRGSSISGWRDLPREGY